MAGEKIIRIMQKAGKPNKEDLTDMLGGTVTSISPLKIRIDEKAELDEDFFILGTMVREMKPTIQGIGEVVLWRGLEVGDRVRMLRVGEGQMFYVIEREEGVI